MQSWPLARSGFNVYVGPVVQGEDRERLRSLVRYVMRAPLCLTRLDDDEASGQVRYRDSDGDVKTWPHAIHFLADLAQHIPKARQRNVSYHGWFANPTGHLSRRQENVEKAGAAGRRECFKWARSCVPAAGSA